MSEQPYRTPDEQHQDRMAQVEKYAKYNALFTVLQPCVGNAEKTVQLMQIVHLVGSKQVKLTDREKLMEYFE